VQEKIVARELQDAGYGASTAADIARRWAHVGKLDPSEARAVKAACRRYGRRSK
jgi:hypothetical protein